MSERETEARRERPPMPEFDHFGFRGHFEPVGQAIIDQALINCMDWIPI